MSEPSSIIISKKRKRKSKMQTIALYKEVLYATLTYIAVFLVLGYALYLKIFS